VYICEWCVCVMCVGVYVWCVKYVGVYVVCVVHVCDVCLSKGKVERERYTQLNAEFQRLASREKKAFLVNKAKE